MTLTGYVIRDEYDQTSKAVVVAEDSTKALALAIEQGIEAHEDPSDLYAVAVPIIWPEGGWTV